MVITRKFAIFSGFDNRVVEIARRRVQGSQITVAFAASKEGVNQVYFDLLLNNSIFNLRRIADDNTILQAVLVSCLTEEGDVALENSAFFPSLRRLQVSQEFRRDINMCEALAKLVIDSLSSPRWALIRELARHTGNAVALLPLDNTNCRRLKTEITNIYNMKSTELSSRLDKEIVNIKGGKGVRIGGLVFSACLNNGSHPVRRMSDRAQCDFVSTLRLGVSVPTRFEFDVSCEKGLAGKMFRHCDGRATQVPGGTSHVNMRINGDFECA